MTLSTLTDRAFGIELEVLRPRGLSYAGLAAKIQAAGIECTEEGYNHQTRSHWKVVSDGSLPSNGAEVVSPKLFGEAGLAQAKTVATVLTNAGCKVSVQTGLHLHVDASDFTAEQMKKVAINYIWFETFFDHIMPASRRGSHNRFIKSNRNRFGGYGTDAVNAAYGVINGADDDIASVIRAAVGGDRYHKLNLTPWFRQQSIEFRQHNGTTDAGKIEHWIRLMIAFVEKSRVSKPRPRTVTRDLSAAEEMSRFFGMFAVPTTTRAFYMARRRELHAAVRNEARIQEAAFANIRQTAEEAIQILEARRQRVLGYARPQRVVASRIYQRISGISYSVQNETAERTYARIQEARRAGFLPSPTPAAL